MDKKHIVVGSIIVLYLLFPLGSCAINITTRDAFDYTTNYVVLNASLTELPNSSSATVYFEYGAVSGVYIHGTADQILTTNQSFNQTVEGIQLIPSKTYYFRAVGNESGNDTLVYGGEKYFPLNPLTPIPTQDFGEHYEELEEAKFNLTKLAVVIPKIYTDIMGDLFFGLLFALIFIGIWLRQEDVGIPAVLGMIVGGSIWAFLPESFIRIAYSLLVVSLGALIYSLIKGRK